MKTRKIIAYILVVVMLAGLLAGCKKTEKKSTATKSGNSSATKATESKSNSEPTKATTATKPSTPTNPSKPTEPEETEPEETVPVKPPAPDCQHIPENRWEVEKFSTCTTEGIRHRYCTQCKGVVETEAIPVRDHDLSAWIVDKMATCAEEGLQHQECKQCKSILIYIQTVKVPHTPDATGLTCKVCKASLSQKVDPAT